MQTSDKLQTESKEQELEVLSPAVFCYRSHFTLKVLYHLKYLLTRWPADMGGGVKRNWATNPKVYVRAKKNKVCVPQSQHAQCLAWVSTLYKERYMLILPEMLPTIHFILNVTTPTGCPGNAMAQALAIQDNRVEWCAIAATMDTSQLEVFMASGFLDVMAILFFNTFIVTEPR